MQKRTGYFSLSGTFNPDEITQQLGIEPSWVQRIGDPGPPGAMGPRKGAEWCLACADDDGGDVADQIISIIRRLSPKALTVAELVTKFEATIYLVAYLKGNYRGFFLSASVVRDLADLNVDVECEYIYFTDEERATDEAIEEARNAD
jgi:hypothetical protein